MGALLIKRAAVGPQHLLARTALGAIALGLLVLGYASQQGDFASWTGAILILAGMCVASVMLIAEIHWLLTFKRSE